MARTESGIMSPLLALLLGTALWPHVLCLFSYNKVIWKDPKNKFWYEGPPVDTFSLAENNANFAFSLYKLLTAQNPGANVIFSPFSISSAMALLALGASKTTQIETLQGLKFNLTKTPEAEIHRGFKLLLSLLRMSQGPLQLNVSNALYLDMNLRLSTSFQKEAQEMYGAETFSASFHDTTNTKKYINSYMKSKTHGKMPELVKFLDPEGQMVLVNCLLFKDKWKMPFDPHNTAKLDFYLSQGRKTKVPMMRIQDLKVPYFLDKKYNCTVVQLPYMNNSVSALFILPNKNNMDRLEANLQLSMLRHWRNLVKMRPINLQLPKFSISRYYDLEEILPIMGINKIFSEKADFSEITTAKNLALSQVIHMAVLDVTEDGTEAAAAKPDNHAPYFENFNSNTVKFNKPFLINLISEDTQNIIYLGKVTNPLKS